MKTQKTIQHFHSLSRVLLFIGIVIAVNILVSRAVFRIDLTQGKIYTLSASTKKIISQLKSPATLKVYFSETNELPEGLISVKQDTLDLISEFEKYGKGNIIVEAANPKTNEKVAKEAFSFGVPEIQFNKFGNKALEVKTGYAGIAITYKNASIPIPFIQSIDSLEYDITSAILKMSTDKVSVIGVLGGHGEDVPEEVKKELQKQYELKDITLESGDYISQDISGLIISGPKNAFSDREKFLLDQYIMRGGKVIALVGGSNVNTGTLIAQPNNTALGDLFTSYGVTLGTNIILDPLSSETLQFKSGIFYIDLNYPPYPKVTNNGINRKNVITSKLQSLVFPFSSSLTIDDSAKNREEEITELVKTTNKSFVVEANNAQLSPNLLNTITPTDQRTRTVAVLIRGKIQSAFQGKEVPKKNLEEKNTTDVKKVQEPPKDQVAYDTQVGALLIVGSGGFLNIDVIRQSPDNFSFFANALDVMVLGDSLVDIRSRDIANRPLAPIEETKAAFIKYANILASSLLSILVGLCAYVIRKRYGNKAKLYYSI